MTAINDYGLFSFVESDKVVEACERLPRIMEGKEVVGFFGLPRTG